LTGSPQDGGRPRDGNTIGDGGGAVVVEILSPTEGAVVAGNTIEITARVVATNGTVDTSTIQATISGLPPVRLVAMGTNMFRSPR
jgi:hypothetical protein